jgi:glucosamine--fructose-6-phosphate aminotransferase (isomerizing)
MYYDGTPLALTAKSLKRTALTSRDIDRQDYPHYFLLKFRDPRRRWKKPLKTAGRSSPAVAGS